MARLVIMGAIALGAALGLEAPAWAQKNSGPLLPVSPYGYTPPAFVPPSAPPLRPYYRPPVSRPAPPSPQAGNPDAERLAQTLPLDPQTRELRDQMPPDPRGTERRLGLREPRGPVIDLRGRTPSPQEIVDALAPR